MDDTPGGAGEQSDYRSYLLRLWREDDEDNGWRASLESSRTGERRGFARLDDLFGFLRQQTGVLRGTDADGNGG